MLGRGLRWCAAALVLAAGCGESHPDGGEDAQIVFDATFPDAGTDAGPPPSNLGAACASDGDCAGGDADYCEPNLGGYCTLICAADEDCPDDAICADLGVSSVCLATCDPGASTDQCLPGNGCAADLGVAPVCLPGCEDDSDCGAGLTCLAGAGSLSSGLCLEEGTELGGACASDADCPTNTECLAGADFPGGTCVLVGCNRLTNTGCPAGAQCLPGGFSGDICWQGCAGDGECRADWECVESQPGRRTCQPRFITENLGGPCGGSGACPGGVCIDEVLNGFPGAYCSAECDLSAAPGGCLGDGVCVEATSGGGLCVDGCESDEDCRAGYRCRAVDRDVPEGPKACYPGCTDDAQCTATTRDGTRYVCNPGSGLCTRPFNPAEIGRTCRDFRDCRGGRCMSEEEDGWQGVICTYPGCRLSGEGPAAECPTGSVCTDDGSGDPTLGVCVTACTVGETACGAGYTCVSPIEGGLQGACRPSCSAGSCSGGRTCNATTGLCE